MGITASNLSFGEVNRRFYGRKLRFTAPLTRRRKTKFPTVKPPIYLPKCQIWMQLSPKYLYFKNRYLHQQKEQIYLTEIEISVLKIKISLFVNLIVFNFYFQQIINTPLLKVFDMLDIYQASEFLDFHDCV